MTIHHLAIWTFRLEELKTFYTTYFKGKSNEKYINPQKGFESYFISFNGGATLESVILDPDGNRIECVYK